jgi:hypothetical protein
MENGQAQKSWRDGIPRGYNVRHLEQVQFCGCANGTSEGPSVHFAADFAKDLIEENHVILDGREVNEVNCSGVWCDIFLRGYGGVRERPEHNLLTEVP